MAAAGVDAGGRGPSLPWSYRLRKQTGRSSSYDNSISSSSSGTIVSTTYTSSSGSRLSSISMDAVKHFELALDEDTECVQPTKKICKEKVMQHMDIKSLVQEFFGAPSVELNNDSNSGDMSVLERWFSELDVAWVLHLPDGDDVSAAALQQSSAAAAERWIRALHRIVEAIRSTSMVISGLPESDKHANNVLDQIHLARFFKEAMSKMLPFVDFAIREVVICINGMPPAPYEKLHSLLAVYEALSVTPNKIWSSFYCDDAEEVEDILEEMVNLVSAKKEEAGGAIWSIMERIRTHVLDSIDIEYGHDSSSSVIPQASSDIHKSTMSVMEYIRFLCSNTSSMCQIVSEAVRLGKYVPQIRQEQPMDSMVMSMKSCLQEKLVKISEPFSDQGLRFLFLLNNFEFIRQSLMDTHSIFFSLESNEFCYSPRYPKEDKVLCEKVESYMENYLHACWEPVLSCLFSPTPLCFGINHSRLLEFDSEFKKTYTTQKLWKVPDPKLRKRLRTAITKKIVPWYTEYIEENNITTPGVAPQDMENMLQELFEG